MNPEQHAQAKQIFMNARGMSGDKQTAYLDEACAGQPGLRAHVRQLLEHDSAPAAGDLTTTQGTVATQVAAAAPADKPSRVELETGSLFADRYQIIARLGAGGMGTVYRANDRTLNQEVALKLLTVEASGDGQWLERFKSEVRLAREISHPNVCRVYDIGFVDQQCYLSMEYIAGDDLQSLLKRVGRVPPDRARSMAVQISSALAALHRKGVLHRDLKPANVMIDSDGAVRLTDFGLATRDKLAGVEAMAGTPAYMAPEQIAGQEVTERSDLYALGLVFYELFTGRRAFQGKTLGEYRALHTTVKPVAPGTLVDDLPNEVERAILQCLEKDPQQRPGSADALALALGGDVLGELMQRGETPSPSLVAAAGSRHETQRPRVIAAMVACFLLVGVLAWWQPRPERDVRHLLPDSPVSLADRARHLSVELGGSNEFDDRSWGLTRDDACHFLLDGDWPYAVAEQAELAIPLVWHRTARQHLAPRIVEDVLLGGARASPHDPPPTEGPGVLVVLGPAGQLLGFERTLSRAPEPQGEIDWAPFFEAAGLDVEQAVASERSIVPRISSDARYTWQVADQRVVASSLLGVPTMFAVLGADPLVRHETAWRLFMTEHAWGLLLVSLLAISGPLAWRNLRLGRSDPRGARRLATAIFVVRMFGWLLTAHHSSEFFAELRLVIFAGFGALGAASIAWLYYVALEPFLRRFWPHTLVSWTRVLAGRVRDPLVGWHVLLGVVIGLFFALLVRLDIGLTEALGWPVRALLPRHDLLLPLQGARFAGASALQLFLSGLSDALALLMVVALLRALIRHPVLAGIVAVILIGPLYIPRGAHPIVSTFMIGVVGAGLAVWLMTRIGLLSLAIAIAVSNLFSTFPVTLDLRHWSSDLAVLSGLVVLGLAGWGTWQALRTDTTAGAPSGG